VEKGKPGFYFFSSRRGPERKAETSPPPPLLRRGGKGEALAFLLPTELRKGKGERRKEKCLLLFYVALRREKGGEGSDHLLRLSGQERLRVFPFLLPKARKGRRKRRAPHRDQRRGRDEKEFLPLLCGSKGKKNGTRRL